MAVLRGPEHVFEFVNHAMVELLGPRDLSSGARCARHLPELEGQRLFDVPRLPCYELGQANTSAYDIPIRVRRGAGSGTGAALLSEPDLPADRRAKARWPASSSKALTSPNSTWRASLVESQVAQLKPRRAASRPSRSNWPTAWRPLGAVEDDRSGPPAALLGRDARTWRGCVFAESARTPSMRVPGCGATGAVPGVDSIAGIDSARSTPTAPVSLQDLRAGNDVVVR
jgi:hypothetical protein